MTKRIFQAICFAALAVFLASGALFFGALYNYFSDMQHRQLRQQTILAARGAANEGMTYFEGLDIENYRITWIDADGKVLYDSKSESAEMENHLEREEIRQAILNGTGESVRYSSTLLKKSLYCAKRLPDHTILRLSVTQNTPLTLILVMLQPICVIFIAALVLSLTLASQLSKAIMKPLNELNLDEPLKNEVYGELSLLLGRIASQQRKIRRQEEKLRQKQSEFETVTKGMEEGIVLLDGKNMILGINPAAMRLLGASQSCVGKYLLAVNRSLKLQEILQKAGDGRHTEIVMELGERKYQFDASPVFANGFVSGIVLLMLDVTKKEEAEQMRREFTANVSHELKTPLHTISGSAELMANGMVKQEDIPTFSERIYAEAQRMIHLVEDIIRLSHLDEGAGDMKWEETDLYALAQETITSLLPEAEKKEVEIKLCGNVATVYGVRQLLQGVLYNLIDNGIKYNRRGGLVTVTLQEKEKEALLSVADTGIGIPAEHQERIFERFYRGDKSHSREIGGTGLGLSIVKHAIKLHDGQITLESTVDEGTAITVYFPKKRKF